MWNVETKMNLLRNKTLAFVGSMHVSGDKPYLYRYSAYSSVPTLYSSCYAVMTLSLHGALDDYTAGQKEQWCAYLNSFQCDDGLFMDPVIYDQGWYEGDPLWCGRPHLTCHVLTALACLGGIAEKPFTYLEPHKNIDFMVQWLKERDWGNEVAYTGNEVMNVGTLLQYARDFHSDDRAGKAVEALLEWLSGNHMNPSAGVWGDIDLSDPFWRSQAVQAAYHWWPLFFYDKFPVPYAECAIDTVLLTQNPLGGFGWGVHNAAEPFHSSACEDIDSIDPLARMMQITPYRRDDIQKTLTKAADWVLKNQMEDGGFVFLLGRDFEYGHREMFGANGKGAMFPTWFRTLTLAILGRALPDHPLGKIPWHFVRCPGFQFWP